VPSNFVPTLRPNGRVGNSKPNPTFMRMLEHNTTLHVIGVIFLGFCVIALTVVVVSIARETIHNRLRPRATITFDRDDH